MKYAFNSSILMNSDTIYRHNFQQQQIIKLKRMD